MRVRAPPLLGRAHLPSRVGRGAECVREGRTPPRSSTAASTAPAARPRPGVPARLEGGRRSVVRSSQIWPVNGRSRAIARRSVVFPAPFGPMSASHSPSATSASTRSTTGRPPSSTVTPRSSITRHHLASFAARGRRTAHRRRQSPLRAGSLLERSLYARRHRRGRGSPLRRPPRAGSARDSRPL